MNLETNIRPVDCRIHLGEKVDLLLLAGIEVRP
jgi:hypothetical protein